MPFLIIVSIIFCYSSFLHSLGDYLWDDHYSDLFWFLWRQIVYCLLIWFSHLCAWNYANLVFKWQVISSPHSFFDTLLREDCFLDELCAFYGLHWTWSLEMDLCTLFLVCLCILPYRLFPYKRSDPKNYNLFSGFINALIVIQHSVRTTESFLVITKTSLVSWSN